MNRDIKDEIEEFAKKLGLSEEHADELSDLCKSAYDDGHGDGRDEAYDDEFDDDLAAANILVEREHLLRHGIEDRDWKLIEEFAEKVGVQWFVSKPAKAG